MSGPSPRRSASRARRVASALVGLLLLASGAARAGADPLAEIIRQRLESVRTLDIGGERLHARSELSGVYERRGFAPVWGSTERRDSPAEQLLEAIAGATAQGLRPSDYHLAELTTRLAEAQPAASRAAETDLLLTDAFLILATHSVRGRVDPASFDPEWIASLREVDVAALLERVASGADPRALLRELRPRHDGYERLVGALARYREIEALGGWPQLEPGPALEPAMNHPSIPTLRQRLRVTGDLAEGEVAEPDHFDDALREALIHFQRRLGLDDDGVVGSKTRAALDVSAAARIRSIELNLERWRWLPQDLGERHLLVDIPAFRLQVSEAGREVLTMRIIVGRVVRQTPVFSDVMSYLVFGPSWEVPPRILREDKLPELRRDPGYALRQNMRVFERASGGWAEVDPRGVDWASATPGTLRLRQKPGPNNALGRVKFMFPNRFNVYLHDTPSRELFARAQRDFSSGCIRIEQPEDLAVYLLGDDPAWTREAVAAAMQTSQERTVTLPRPIPIHIQYWTAWARPDGAVEFRHDLYGRDERLDGALRLPPPGGATP